MIFIIITFISDKNTSIKQLTVEANIKIWKNLFISKISNDEINNILKILKLDILKIKKLIHYL